MTRKCNARAGLRMAAASFLFMLVLSVAMTYPLILHLDSAVASPWDPLFSAYGFAHAAKIVTNPLDYGNSHMFFPLEGTFLTENPMVGTALIGLPLYLLSGNAVLNYNVIIVITFFLNSLFMYLLVRYMTGSRIAALLSGVIYAYAPLKFDVWGGILSTQWMPLSFLFLHKYVKSACIPPAGRRVHTLSLRANGNMVLFGLFFGVQILADLNMAAFFLPVPALYLLYHLALRKLKLSLALVANVILAAVIACALNAPFVVPLLSAGPSGRAGISDRTVEEQEFLSADVSGYVLTPPQNRLYGWITKKYEIFGGQHTFPGVLAVLLCAAAFLPRRRGCAGGPANVFRRKEGTFFLLLAAFGLLMSLGPRIHFLGHRLFFGPYMLLHMFVPGYDRIRAIGWFAVVFVFAVAVLAGIGYARLAASAKRPRVMGAVGVLFLVFLLVEYSNDNSHAGYWSDLCGDYYFVSPEPPEVYRWLKEQPGDFGIIEMPMPRNNGEFETGGYEMLYAIRALFHGKRVANGYGSFEPPYYWPLVDLMSGFPSPESLEVLQAMSVRYVVLHVEPPGGAELAREHCAPGVSPETVERAMEEKEYLRLVRRSDTEYVFEVLPPAEQRTPQALTPTEREISPSGFTATADVRQEDASLAFDGDPGTSWSTYRGVNVYNNDHSFVLDLGEPRRASALEIRYGNKYQVPRGLVLEVSADGTRWGSVDTSGALADLVLRLLEDPSDNRFLVRLPGEEVRYLKLVETLPQLDWSIGEIAVFEHE